MSISRQALFLSALLGFMCCLFLWAVCYRAILSYQCASPPDLIRRITFLLMSIALIVRVAEHFFKKRQRGLESVFLKAREIFGYFGIAFFLSYIFLFSVVMGG